MKRIYNVYINISLGIRPSPDLAKLFVDYLFSGYWHCVYLFCILVFDSISLVLNVSRVHIYFEINFLTRLSLWQRTLKQKFKVP